MIDIHQQFIDGQISDAKAQIQIALTSMFMAEDRLRRCPNPSLIQANKIFELRKQISKQVQDVLGETPCLPAHNHFKTLSEDYRPPA